MGNQGIIQYGGNIQAGALAVGTNAQAFSKAYEALAGKGMDEIKSKLQELVQAIGTHSSQLANPSEVHKSAEELASELGKEKPETPTVLRILKQIASGAGNVTTIVTAVKGLIGAVTLLL